MHGSLLPAVLALLFAACGNPASGGRDTGVSFTTPAQYREMVLATPNAVSTVTITGDATYYSNSDNANNKGVFIVDRTVTLSPFKIAKYETTYELWYEVNQWAESNGYTFATKGGEGHNGTNGAAPSSTGTAKTEPVTWISWRDAIVWCNAYSEMDGKEPVYYTDKGYGKVLRTSTNDPETTEADQAVMKPGANGYRLPTEAQWEYAARGGGAPSTTGTFVYRYAGSDTVGDVAWCYDNSSALGIGHADYGTHPAGEKTANGLGLYDMSGNVWEWCWDRYGDVGTGTATDPEGAASGGGRAVRGGCWNSSGSACAVSFRYSSAPSYRDRDLGFRVSCL
jgi:formylglycine-generating enzyme required for sulfatase activity